MQLTSKEKKNQRLAVFYSVGSHVLVILIFFFMVAWRAPDPPLPEIGIELNFGLDKSGSGEEQPEPNVQPSDSDNEEEAKPDGLEETPEETTENEQVEEEIVEPTEEVSDVPTEEKVTPITTTQDSPDVIKKKTEPVVTKETPVKENVEEKVEETPKLPPVLYPNNKTGAGGKDGKANEAANANQGDKVGAIGDQGDKEGTIDSRALYGKAGGGGGSSLQMSGWMWDNEPNPKDTSSESGKLVFQVVIDDKGSIVRVITVESSVSPTLEKIYKDEVSRLTFSKTAGTSVASSSTGTITFVIKAR